MHWLSLTLLGFVAAQSSDHPKLFNGDFSSVERGAPAGWVLNRNDGADPRMSLTVANGAAQIVPAGVMPGDRVRLMQRISAEPWRGQLIRLSARVRVIRPGEHVGLRLHVLRPEGRSGFYDYMDGASIEQGDWRTVSLVGVVEEDATVIEVGASLAGLAEIEIDDIKLETFEGKGPPSEQARNYLDEAIEIVRSDHIDAPGKDWAAIRQRAHQLSSGAASTTDTYPAIRSVLSAMGDNHSSLIVPLKSESAADGPAQNTALPSHELLRGRFGMIALPPLRTLGTSSSGIADAYVRKLRTAIATLDRQHLCGWIIDLRANTGGNVWPMVNGLAPLLGEPPFGAFVSPDGKKRPWVVRDGLVVAEGIDASTFGFRLESYPTVRHGSMPLAVLLSPRTASSGEGVAIAFAGRPRARTFGQPSGGYTTANRGFGLADGAILNIPVSWKADRTGREYRSVLTPDEVTEPGKEVEAASRWLASQCQ